MIAYEDHAGIEESAYLLRSPKNVQRLRESIESYRNGTGRERRQIEDTE